MKKSLFRATAVAAAVALLATAVGAFGSVRDTSKNADGTPAASKKDEIVYVFTDAEGNTKNVLVSDWLTNPQKADSLTDCSNLKDLENVKGEEGYTAGKDDSIVWQADGNDIYYQGTSDQTPPVSMKATYLFDGQPITPDKLLGKTGVVTIRYEYTNNETQQVKIDGKNETLCVPFAALTGMILDNEHFRNVSVSNGKIVNDGQRTVVVGFALPGMNDALQTTLLPNTVEITADVTDFTLGTSMTLVTNELFSAVNFDKLTDKKTQLTDALNQLTDAMDQLMDGSSKLYSGMTELLEKSGDLVNGVDALKDGAQSLYDGTSSLYSGTTELHSGANQLQSGANQLYSGASQLHSGTSDLYAGASQIHAGASQVHSGASDLSNGLNTLSGKSKELVAGADQIFDALLNAATTQLTAAGLDIPALTQENYQTVLNGAISQLDADTVRAAATAQAREQVEEAVRANTAAIQAAVTAKVQEQVRAAVLQQLGLSGAELTAEQQATVDAVVAQQMASEEIQAQIAAAVESTIQSTIEEQLQSEAVQSQIEAAVAKAVSGSGTVSALLAQLNQVATFCDGVDQYTAGVDSAAVGAAALNAGADSLETGAGSLVSGASSLQSGAGSLETGTNSLKSGVGSLASGADSLESGAAQLNSGAAQLNDGLATLQDGVSALVDGVKQLKDGQMQLSDGLKKFKSEGIDKLTEAVNGNLSLLFDRMQAISELSQSYQSFSGVSEGTQGSVRFLYRTDAIEK